MSDQAEIDRLEEVIAAGDAEGGALGRWRAADALESKAAIVHERDGAAAALPLHAEVVSRLEGLTDPDAREMRICEMYIVAETLSELGRPVESRQLAERILDEYFEDPPENAEDVVIDAAILLADLLNQSDGPRAAVAVLDRLVRRYGANPVTAAMALANAALYLGDSGAFGEAIERQDRVIALLSGHVEDRPRRMLSRAMTMQGYYLYKAGETAPGRARCIEVLERFGGDPDPQIGEMVASAREMLEGEDRHDRRLGWPL